MPSDRYHVDPIHYNSRCITFPEWVSLFTLCLAPLIAHVASGTPPISYLTHSRPKWYDRLCHYNPTSIIWRYAAITDRRIRATCWSRNDLAASNAIFWTKAGWNGEENMVFAAAPHCSHYPELTHVQIMSVTMLKTIITTLQGISALYLLIGMLVGSIHFDFTGFTSVDSLFYPLAVLGLLRLCAATWLTEDFEYRRYTSQESAISMILPQSRRSPTYNDCGIELMDSDKALDPFLITPLQTGVRFKSPNSSRSSCVFRIFYVLILGGVWAIAFVYLVPLTGYREFTTTEFLIVLFYTVLLTISVILYAFYFFRGQTTSTLLPCISSAWYRVYTLFLMSFMFLLVIMSGTETSKWPEGLYATQRPLLGDQECTAKQWWYFMPNYTFVGFASRMERIPMRLGLNYTGISAAGTSGNNASSGEEYWLYGFTGYCVGLLEDMGR